jgi:hypothetical protein
LPQFANILGGVSHVLVITPRPQPGSKRIIDTLTRGSEMFFLNCRPNQIGYTHSLLAGDRLQRGRGPIFKINLLTSHIPTIYDPGKVDIAFKYQRKSRAIPFGLPGSGLESESVPKRKPYSFSLIR